MSKAVLVFDMPKDCIQCMLRHDNVADKSFCKITEDPDYKGWPKQIPQEMLFSGKRADWCPLKEMPGRMIEEEPSCNNEACHQSIKNVGWNECLKEIEKRNERDWR